LDLRRLDHLPRERYGNDQPPCFASSPKLILAQEF